MHLLAEYNKLQSEKQFSKLLKREDIIDHYGGVSDSLFNDLEYIDSEKTEYVNKFLSKLNKKVISIEYIVKNKEKLKKALQQYKTLLKTKEKDRLPSFDKLNSEKDFDDFISIIDEKYREHIESKDSGSGEVIYKASDGTKFYISYDTKHACYIGRGTKWCTSARDNNLFDNMNRFFHIITLIPEKKKNPREKYQFNIGKPEARKKENEVLFSVYENKLFDYLNKPVFSYDIPDKNIHKIFYEFMFNYAFHTFYASSSFYKKMFANILKTVKEFEKNSLKSYVSAYMDQLMLKKKKNRFFPNLDEFNKDYLLDYLLDNDIKTHQDFEGQIYKKNFPDLEDFYTLSGVFEIWFLLKMRSLSLDDDEDLEEYDEVEELQL